VDPKPTLDNWNNLPRRTIKQNQQIHTQPIHVDSHSHIDTWSDHIKQRRASTSIIHEQPMIIHYDDVKSTIDNWQEKKKSYPRSRPKLFQVNINYSNFNKYHFLSRHLQHQ
jgi:hypothetical protein